MGVNCRGVVGGRLGPRHPRDRPVGTGRTVKGVRQATQSADWQGRWRGGRGGRGGPGGLGQRSGTGRWRGCVGRPRAPFGTDGERVGLEAWSDAYVN